MAMIMTPDKQLFRVFQFDPEVANRVIEFASQYTFPPYQFSPLLVGNIPSLDQKPDITLTNHGNPTEQNPQHREFIKHVTDYCYNVMSPEHQAQVDQYGRNPEEPASKKRKIDPSDTSVQYPGSVKKPTTSTSYIRDEETEHLLFSAEASFAVPVRKKLSVSFYHSAKEGPGYGGLEVEGGDVRYGFRWVDIGTSNAHAEF